MQLIKDLFSVNEILTVSLLGWFVAQVLKTIINFILLGKFQLERMWGDGGMPSAHSATVCAMVIATARSAGVGSSIFAVASVVFAEHAPERDGRPYTTAGGGRRSGRCCGRAPLPDEPGVRIFRKKNEKDVEL